MNEYIIRFTDKEIWEIQVAAFEKMQKCRDTSLCRTPTEALKANDTIEHLSSVIQKLSEGATFQCPCVLQVDACPFVSENCPKKKQTT